MGKGREAERAWRKKGSRNVHRRTRVACEKNLGKINRQGGKSQFAQKGEGNSWPSERREEESYGRKMDLGGVEGKLGLIDEKGGGGGKIDPGGGGPSPQKGGKEKGKERDLDAGRCRDSGSWGRKGLIVWGLDFGGPEIGLGRTMVKKLTHIKKRGKGERLRKRGKNKAGLTNRGMEEKILRKQEASSNNTQERGGKER